VLVGGIGYRNLRDGSIGLHVIERLADRAGDGIEVEDVSYHPVGLLHNLQERPDYDRIVLVGAVARGREPGTVTAYRWDRWLPADDEVQARVRLNNHLNSFPIVNGGTFNQRGAE